MTMASEIRLQSHDLPSPNAPKQYTEPIVHSTEPETTQVVPETDLAWELVKEECHDGLFFNAVAIDCSERELTTDPGSPRTVAEHSPAQLYANERAR